MAAGIENDSLRLPDVPQSGWQRWREVLLIVLVFFIVAGDVPPSVNESHYLCRLKHYWNPNWCRGDLFLESTDTQVVFIWLFGWVTRFVSLTATAWIGRGIVWTLLAWAWQRLSWRLVPRSFAAVLSASLFIALNSYAHMAGEWVVGGVEAKCFAYAFVLMALCALLDDRWKYVWLLLGVATAFHPLVGGWNGVACFALWLVEGRRGRFADPRPALSQRERVLDVSQWERVLGMLPSLAVGGLIALIGIVPALTLTWGVPAETVSEAIRIYVFDRLPHHLAPLTLPTAEVTRRLSGHAILLAALAGLTAVVWRRLVGTRRLTEAELNELRQSPDALNARKQLGPRQGAGGGDAPARGVVVDSAPYLHALWRVAMFAWVAVLIAATGLAIELVFWSHPEIAGKLLRDYWFRTTDFAAPLATAFIATSLVVAALDQRRRWAVAALAGLMALVGYSLVDYSMPRYMAWRDGTELAPTADNKVVDYPAWVEVCDWVKDNTPDDALFITPRLNSTFKWRTGRPEVVNRKDIPQDAGGIVEWSHRLNDIYTTRIEGQDVTVDSVATLGDERVRELAREYHAQYVLSDRGQLLSLPVAFRNREYAVYRIENPSVGNGR